MRAKRSTLQYEQDLCFVVSFGSEHSGSDCSTHIGLHPWAVGRVDTEIVVHLVRQYPVHAKQLVDMGMPWRGRPRTYMSPKKVPSKAAPYVLSIVMPSGRTSGGIPDPSRESVTAFKFEGEAMRVKEAREAERTASG